MLNRLHPRASTAPLQHGIVRMQRHIEKEQKLYMTEHSTWILFLFYSMTATITTTVHTGQHTAGSVAFKTRPITGMGTDQESFFRSHYFPLVTSVHTSHIQYTFRSPTQWSLKWHISMVSKHFLRSAKYLCSNKILTTAIAQLAN